MEAIEIERLLKRHQAAMSRKEEWRSLLDDAYFYSMPNRNPWQMTQRGDNMNSQVYDNTLPLALNKFVNRTITALCPPEIDWLKLIPGMYVDDEIKAQLAEQLQDDTDALFYYLRKSNFDVVVQEGFEDMAVSTGVLQINEGDIDDPLIFSAVPNDMVGLETDGRGDLSGFFRSYKKIPLDHVRQLWGDDVKIEPQVLNQEPPHYMNVAECSYWCFKDKLYKYFVIDTDNKSMMLEDKDESWPWIGFRWSRRPGEDRGRGPALMATPTAATINRAIEDELRSAALKASPPYMAFHDYVINPYTFKVEPNTIIPVNPLGTETWPIAQLPAGGDITFSALVINDLRAQINEIMFTQPLQPLMNEPVRTATEVAIKQNEMRENQGASYSRVQRELLLPLVKRVLYILNKKGLMRPVEIDGRRVDVSFATPLSTTKDANDVKNFMEYFQLLSALFTPGIAINMVDAPKLPRWIGEKINSELTLIKSEQQIIQLVQQAAEMAQGAAEQQQPGPAEVPPGIPGLTA